MKKYDNYKDSGIEWLGKIPENWTLTKLKYYLSIQSGGGINNSEIDENANYYIYGGNGIMGKTNNTNSSGEVLIIGRVGALCGNVHLVEDDIWISDNALWGKSNQNQKFLYYYLKYLDLNRLANKNAQPLITGTMVKEQFIGLPSKEEQTTIATYLDHKTTQIDTLIEKKEKLIEKLKQQRQAIINEAVTKGLNPDAPMKDSGIEWLGKIPEHWEVVKLKHIVQHSTEKGNGDSELKIALENIEGQTGVFLGNEQKDFEGDLKTFKKGDILFNKLRPYLAKVFKAPKDGECVSELLVFTCIESLIQSDFLFWRLISQQVISVVDSSTYGAKMPRASVDFVLNLTIALPSLEEQNLISNHIDIKTRSIFEAIQKLQESIEKLKLYRQSIISEAVTGKIDVRDWKKPEKK